MSTVNRDLERINSRELATANKRNQRELASLETNHGKLKAELKETHQGEKVELQTEHQSQLNRETEKKEKVLGELRTNLQQTTKLTEKQLDELKDSSTKQKNHIQQDLIAQSEILTGEHELQLSELNGRFNDSTKKVIETGRSRLDALSREMKQKHSHDKEHLEGKIHQQKENFETTFSREGLLYETMKNDQDGMFKKDRLNANQKQQVDLVKQNDQHLTTFELRDQDFRKGIKEQDLFFEKKFQTTLQNHNGQFKNLNDRHDKVTNKMKTELATDLTRAVTRADDPFYQFVELGPKLTELRDHVEIAVKVPEYSKQDLLLTTNGKEAILNFNRRYTDSNRNQDGTLNKINKVETFITRLQAGATLDAKSIKSTYENGVMTYFIKKA
ncbi:MAG TPA: hypothetical protein VNJ01_05430 [Bacteriovoracaceae bacterium]|nr:hypothetical protein [Bacteriovoracaceae bacterium]